MEGLGFFRLCGHAQHAQGRLLHSMNILLAKNSLHNFAIANLLGLRAFAKGAQQDAYVSSPPH
jgi:hypothetical protein